MYKYLLFDADNTLLDFNAAEKQALKEALAECPLQYSEEVRCRYHAINDNEWKRLERGETTREILKYERFEKLYDEFGINGKEFGRYTADIYFEKLCLQGQMIDCAEEMLKDLSEKYDCYIVTNGTCAIQTERFARTPISKYVKHIFISEQIGYSKPSLHFFEKVFEFIGDSDKSKYLVIGDSLTSDITGAVNSGVDSVWISENHTHDLPTYCIKNLSELRSILN